MEKKNIFHKKLVMRRKELGLTQEQLAMRMNVSPQAVSKWENSSYPDAELLPKLAKTLNISLDSLFGVRSNDTEVDLEQIVHDTIHNVSPDKRSEIMMRIVYSAINAHGQSNDEVKRLHHNFERETFSGLRSDYEIALARLNKDLRYFIYMEKPENGVNQYFTNTKNMVRLLNTLADEDAIRIISYLGSGCRNKLYSPSIISKRLNIDINKVQKVIDRLDRFGLVWRMAADTEEGLSIMYGYTHSQPVAMILALAQSLSNYLQFWDGYEDNYSTGMFKDETGHNTDTIPQVSWWDENDY